MKLFHITKRDTLPLTYAVLIRVVAILLSLVFCGVVTLLLTGENLKLSTGKSTKKKSSSKRKSSKRKGKRKR